MDVLKTARHRAGIHTAVYRVQFPLTILAFVVFVTIVFTGYRDDSEWLFYLLAGIMAAMPLSGGIAYLLARKSPQLVREELESIIHLEKILLPCIEKIIEEQRQKLAGLHQEWAAKTEEIYTRTAQVFKTLAVRGIGDSIATLTALDDEASRECKIRNEGLFLQLQKVRREGEEFLKHIQNTEIPEYSEEIGQSIRTAIKDDLQNLETLMKKQIALWEKRADGSRRVIADAQKALREIS